MRSAGCISTSAFVASSWNADGKSAAQARIAGQLRRSPAGAFTINRQNNTPLGNLSTHGLGDLGCRAGHCSIGNKDSIHLSVNNVDALVAPASHRSGGDVPQAGALAYNT